MRMFYYSSSSFILQEIDGIHGDVIEVTSQGVSKHAKILQAKVSHWGEGY